MSLEQKLRECYKKPSVQVFFYEAQEVVCTSAGSSFSDWEEDGTVMSTPTDSVLKQ